MTARKLALVCLFLFTSAILCAAKPPAPEPAASAPLEAELLSRVTSRSVKPGSLVYARATLDWTVPGCALAKGAAIEGTVTAVVPHGARSHQSELAVSFERAQCGGQELQPFSFRLAAVAAPPDPELSSLPTALPMAMEPGLHPADMQTEPPARDASRFPSNSRFRPGEVLGIPGIRLSVGNGSDNSSVFTRRGYDVALEEHTRLLLLPMSDAAAEAATAAPRSEEPIMLPAAELRSISSPREADAAGPDECTSRACDAESASPEAVPQEKFLASFPLKQLGYSPRPDAEILDASPDEVLAWLSPRQLLITFNPHLLIPRHNDHFDGCVRVIRAVLMDTRTHTVLRSMEWHMLDRKQFLWALPRNRVLVHVGNELRVYGADMAVERRIELTGPLAFGRVSPDGKTIAIGIVQERHAPQLHQLLAVSLRHDPDENVQVLVLNDRFETLAWSSSTSDQTAPVLLDEGQVSVHAGMTRGMPEQRSYQLQVRRWDNATFSLGRFISTCSPTLSTLRPNLLFLVTCDTLNGAREYRVMRPDGSTILHGHSLLREMGHDARASADGNAFAIRVFRADQPLQPAESFHASDLESVELAIYDAQNGKKLYKVRMKDPAPSAAGYAVSDAGQVAVLGKDHVELYSIPKN